MKTQQLHAHQTTYKFSETIKQLGAYPILKNAITTIQLNMGKMCNQMCSHCHVNAAPGRSETMSKEVADKVIQLIDNTPSVERIDFTGGAPELSPLFRKLVSEMANRKKTIINRSNITILEDPKMADLAEFLAQNKVQIVASLPCYTKENVDRQRGNDVFQKSINGLLRLNGIGYGIHKDLPLTLVYNPGGAFLPGKQEDLQLAYSKRLQTDFGIKFTNLITITNMPIGRFAEHLKINGELNHYLLLLRKSFNASTLNGIMCNSLINISFDGTLYDCDFNQAIELPILDSQNTTISVFNIDSFENLTAKPLRFEDHCFGCTAGSGSGCFGTLR